MTHSAFHLSPARRLLFVTLALACAAALGRAQPASATFRPSLVNSFSAGYTYSGTGDLSRGDVTVGDVSLSRFDFNVAGRVPLSASVLFIPGLAYERTTIDATSGTPLPGSVQELSASLGFRGFLSRQWAWGAFLRPGFYGDFKELGSDSFNAPLLLTTFYAPREGLTWIFGLSVNAFNDTPVLPAVGVRWKFAPEWELEVGFPRTGVSYRSSPELLWRAGLSVSGGNYRITESLGVPAPGIARLANTYLAVTEVRVGAGATYTFAKNLDLDLGIGVTTLRRFDYPDRNYRLNGENVGWLSLALNQRL
jgi:hypothetical protein